MITIIHGNDTASSRKFYIEERNRFNSYNLIEGKEINYDKIYQSIEGNSLFEDGKNILIENLFSSLKANSSEYKKIIEYLNKTKFSVFIWEGKELTRPQQYLFKNADIKTFNFPANLFTFLDSLRPNNLTSLKLFKELEQTMETELIFYMIIRQFRLMIHSLDPSNPTEETRSMQPWLKSKLVKQASLFGKSKLVSLYKRLYIIDYKTKFGLSPFNTSPSIDIFLLDL